MLEANVSKSAKSVLLARIIDGISEKLNSVFGDEYEIYTEQIKQGMKTPCFFIQLITPENVQIMGNRYFRKNLFCIQFFPSSNEPNAECCYMQDALYLALEHITVDGDLQRGIKMCGEFIDGVLHFFVNYNMYIKKIEDITLMETLEVPDIKTKG